MKVNISSPDFPFKTKYSDYLTSSKTHHSLPKLQYKSLHNYYTNETPDIFRLDSMTKSPKGYNNPYLNEIIDINRNDSIQQIEHNKHHIRLIDQLKSSRELSQNTFLIQKVNNHHHPLISPRSKVPLKRLKLKEIAIDDPIYNERLKKLVNSSPKIPFRLKDKIDYTKTTEVGNSTYRCHSLDVKGIEKLRTSVDPLRLASLRNYNDYDIKENMGDDYDRKFHHERLEEIVYNPILNKSIKYKPEMLSTYKWNKSLESLVLLNGRFHRQGGLFSEFCNKHKDKIDLQLLEKTLIKKSQKSKENSPDFNRKKMH